MRLRKVARLLVFTLALTAAAQQSAAPDWAALPDDLLRTLEAKSQGYARRALKFSCRETVREADYDRGEAGRERERVHDYLLIEDPLRPEGFSALRTKPGSTDTASFEPDFPEPFNWTALFVPRVRSTLRFKVGDWHTTPWRLAIPISWASSAPVLEKTRVTEWSGTVEVEYRTGNVVQLVARPSMQDERIVAELDRYRQAFRFMGYSAAPPPVGLELTAHFDAEHFGFTYPSRVEIVAFQQVHDDTREILTRRTIEYSNYRFFGTTTEDRIPPLTWRPPENE